MCVEDSRLSEGPDRRRDIGLDGGMHVPWLGPPRHQQRISGQVRIAAMQLKVLVVLAR